MRHEGGGDAGGEERRRTCDSAAGVLRSAIAWVGLFGSLRPVLRPLLVLGPNNSSYKQGFGWVSARCISAHHRYPP